MRLPESPDSQHGQAVIESETWRWSGDSPTSAGKPGSGRGGEKDTVDNTKFGRAFFALVDSFLARCVEHARPPPLLPPRAQASCLRRLWEAWEADIPATLHSMVHVPATLLTPPKSCKEDSDSDHSLMHGEGCDRGPRRRLHLARA